MNLILRVGKLYLVLIGINPGKGLKDIAQSFSDIKTPNPKLILLADSLDYFYHPLGTIPAWRMLIGTNVRACNYINLALSALCVIYRSFSYDDI